MNAPTYMPATFLSPLAVGSRKTHGGAGSFDVNILASNGLGIESRTAGSGSSHQVVFTFANPVTIADAIATPGPNATGSVAGAPIANGNHVTVNLSNVSNQQRLTIKLHGVSDGVIANDFLVPMGLLSGDVNANGAVESSDVSAVQGHTRQRVSNSTFIYDVNCNGSIESSDVSTVQANNSKHL